MPDVAFADLVEIYRHTRFDGVGDGVLTIATPGILGTLQAIEGDPQLYDSTQVGLVDDVRPTLGSDVRVTA